MLPERDGRRGRDPPRRTSLRPSRPARQGPSDAYRAHHDAPRTVHRSTRAERLLIGWRHCRDPAPEDASEDLASTIDIAISQAPTACNGRTAADAVCNTHFQKLAHSAFVALAANGDPEPDEEFGAHERTSDDPLTITYTINEDAVWCDGTRSTTTS
jgi:hypothetical protein